MLLPSALSCPQRPAARPRLQPSLFASPPASPPSHPNAQSALFATCRALQSMLSSAPPPAPQSQSQVQGRAQLPTPPMRNATLPSPSPMKLRLRSHKGACREEGGAKKGEASAEASAPGWWGKLFS